MGVAGPVDAAGSRGDAGGPRDVHGFGRKRRRPGPLPQAVVPAPAARPAASASPPPAPPATITSAWLDEQLAGSRTARVIDDYLGDVGCLAGAAALDTHKARGSAAALVAAGEQVPCDLDAIIVTISAYEDSNSRWQADRTLATIQSAVTAANYTLERFHLPRSGSGESKEASDTDSDARHGPGVLLFRRSRGRAGRRVAVATT